MSNFCLNPKCGKETHRPKYCSRRCLKLVANRRYIINHPKNLEPKYCASCGSEFFEKYKKYCDECRDINKQTRYKKSRQNNGVGLVFLCSLDVCGKPFTKIHQRQTYCSKDCRKKHIRKVKNEYVKQHGRNYSIQSLRVKKQGDALRWRNRNTIVEAMLETFPDLRSLYPKSDRQNLPTYYECILSIYRSASALFYKRIIATKSKRRGMLLNTARVNYSQYAEMVLFFDEKISEIIEIRKDINRRKSREINKERNTAARSIYNLAIEQFPNILEEVKNA